MCSATNVRRRCSPRPTPRSIRSASVTPAGASRSRPPPTAPTRGDSPREPGATASRTSLGLRNDPDVGLRLFPLAVELFGLVVRDGAGEDDVLARLPVHRRGHTVLGVQLQ